MNKNNNIPRLRFKGFTDAWEQDRLGELVTIVKGEQLSVKNFSENGVYYVLNGGVYPSGFTNDFNTESNTISISEGGNSCGFVNLNKNKFWSGGHNYTLLKPKIDINFLFSQLKMKQDLIMALRVGSGLPNIQRAPLENFKIEKTNDLEQSKIGILFRAFDQLITLHQRT